MILDNVRSFQTIPNIDLQDVELKALKLAVVVPEASINFMSNPSVEVNTANYFSKVAPARDNTVLAAFGRYALKITPLDTNYSQVMAALIPDNNTDLRLPTYPSSIPTTVSFDVYGRPGESILITAEIPGSVDFFNRTGVLNNGNDDGGRLYTATGGFVIANNRLEATTLTDKSKAVINHSIAMARLGRYEVDGIFEADIRGIFTSGAVGAWPVLLINYFPGGGEQWLGVRAEQGQVKLLSYVSGVETSIATGAFTFVTGTQYNIRVENVRQTSGDYFCSVYVNNTLVISNATVTNALLNSIGGSASGAWLTVVGAPSGVNPYLDNLVFRNNTKLATKVVKLTSDYQRVSLTFTYTGFRTMLFIEKLIPYTMNPFWLDAFQYELKSYATTYFDGDFEGTWDGIPGQSTATRSAVQTGGRIVGFNDLFARLTGAQGFGLPPIENQSIPLVSTGGEAYQQTLGRKRVKNLIFTVNGDNAQDLARKMRAIENCFLPDALTGTAKNTKLLYQIVDPVFGAARSAVLQSSVKYRAGLEGNQNNDFQQKFALQLEALQTPDITEFYPESVTIPSISGSGLYEPVSGKLRSNGVWGNAPPGSVGSGNAVRTVYIDRRNAFWGGANNGVIFQGNTIDTAYPAVSVTGASTTALAFLLMPNGYMYIGGSFTSPGNYFIRSVGGGAAFAQAGGATWNGDVNVLAALLDGRILIGGNFTLPFPYLAVYNPATNVAAAIIPGLNGQVRDIAVLPDGSGFYFCGDFTTSTAVAVLNRIGFYNLKTNTVSALGTGVNASCRALALGPNNKLYLGGGFTTAGGVTIGNIAAWNGYSFESVGASAIGLDSTVYDLAYNPADGMLYAVGSFLKTGTRELTPGFAKFNGSIWLPTDFAMYPGTGILMSSIAVNANYLLTGAVAYGTITSATYGITGSASVGQAVDMVYTGTAGTNPKIIFDNSTGTSPIKLFQLWNYTTNKTLYFDKDVAIGEVLTIEITPVAVKVSSNYGGDRPNAILPGSDVASFGFNNGANRLVFTSTATNGTNFQAYIYYRNNHWSFNGGVY